MFGGRPVVARVEGDALERRLASGRLLPEHAYELSYLLASAVAERLRLCTSGFTSDLWDLDYRTPALVKKGRRRHLSDPERLLDELFRARHGSLVARTQAARAGELFARMYKVQALGQGRGQEVLDDAVDQFDHLRLVADGEKENSQGTIDLHQARTNTELTIAAERLAVIAAVTLPVPAVSSILGMTVNVNDATQEAGSRSQSCPWWLCPRCCSRGRSARAGGGRTSWQTDTRRASGRRRRRRGVPLVGSGADPVARLVADRRAAPYSPTTRHQEWA